MPETTAIEDLRARLAKTEEERSDYARRCNGLAIELQQLREEMAELTCHFCGGDGTIEVERILGESVCETCPSCHGIGSMAAERDILLNAVECFACGGWGNAPGPYGMLETCQECKGHGQLSVPQMLARQHRLEQRIEQLSNKLHIARALLRHEPKPRFHQPTRREVRLLREAALLRRELSATLRGCLAGAREMGADLCRLKEGILEFEDAWNAWLERDNLYFDGGLTNALDKLLSLVPSPDAAALRETLGLAECDEVPNAHS